MTKVITEHNLIVMDIARKALSQSMQTITKEGFDCSKAPYITVQTLPHINKVEIGISNLNIGDVMKDMRLNERDFFAYMNKARTRRTLWLPLAQNLDDLDTMSYDLQTYVSFIKKVIGKLK